jgi:hypothetical protein
VPVWTLSHFKACLLATAERCWWGPKLLPHLDEENDMTSGRWWVGTGANREDMGAKALISSGTELQLANAFELLHERLSRERINPRGPEQLSISNRLTLRMLAAEVLVGHEPFREAIFRKHGADAVFRALQLTDPRLLIGKIMRATVAVPFQEWLLTVRNIDPEVELGSPGHITAMSSIHLFYPSTHPGPDELRKIANDPQALQRFIGFSPGLHGHGSQRRDGKFTSFVAGGAPRDPTRPSKGEPPLLTHIVGKTTPIESRSDSIAPWLTPRKTIELGTEGLNFLILNFDSNPNRFVHFDLTEVTTVPPGRVYDFLAGHLVHMVHPQSDHYTVTITTYSRPMTHIETDANGARLPDEGTIALVHPDALLRGPWWMGGKDALERRGWKKTVTSGGDVTYTKDRKVRYPSEKKALNNLSQTMKITEKVLLKSLTRYGVSFDSSKWTYPSAK